MNPQKKDLPPGIPLNFMWRADASSYGSEIATYRYGWDVCDPTERLDLCEEITKPSTPPRYFNPNNSYGPGGFTYVEIYDPEYWMDRNYVTSQACFHPMYRMRSRNTDEPYRFIQRLRET
ncbi:MAG: hypothetical protein KAX38_00220 [Candidatus Krumholzibacteria bacterium]|nr:hypothetical protein [Candidatus Krumholzibacteria bacterium]